MYIIIYNIIIYFYIILHCIYYHYYTYMHANTIGIFLIQGSSIKKSQGIYGIKIV